MGATRAEAPTVAGQSAKSPTTPDRRGTATTRWVLRVLAASVLVASCWLLIWGPSYDSCKTTTSRTTGSNSGETTVTSAKSCAPRDTALPDVLPLVAVVGLLLIGELSEVSIPGILSLKTKVEQQASKQEQLEQQLLDVRLTATQNQAVNNYFGESAYQNPRAANASAREKAGDASSTATPADSATTTSNDTGLDSSKYQVISRYESIGPFVMLAQQLARGRRPDEIARRMAPSQLEALGNLEGLSSDLVVDWFHRFRPEIEAVRGVRNSVAHPPSLVTEDDLQATLDTIGVLESDLRQRGLLPTTEQGGHYYGRDG